MNGGESRNRSGGSVFSRYPVTTFVVLAYFVGFGLSIPIFLFGIKWLGLLAAASASIAGIATAALTEGKHGLKNLFSAFTRVRCNALWYVLAILIPPAIVIVAIGISSLFGNPFPIPGRDRWAMLIPMFLIVTIQAGIGEEIGWRGYATPKLRERYGALTAALIVGVAWALWHSPLYLFPGFIQHDIAQTIGFVNTFVVYSLYILAASVMHAWIYFVLSCFRWNWNFPSYEIALYHYGGNHDQRQEEVPHT